MKTEERKTKRILNPRIREALEVLADFACIGTCIVAFYVFVILMR